MPFPTSLMPLKSCPSAWIFTQPVTGLVASTLSPAAPTSHSSQGGGVLIRLGTLCLKLCNGFPHTWNEIQNTVVYKVLRNSVADNLDLISPTQLAISATQAFGFPHKAKLFPTFQLFTYFFLLGLLFTQNLQMISTFTSFSSMPKCFSSLSTITVPFPLVFIHLFIHSKRIEHLLSAHY